MACAAIASAEKNGVGSTRRPASRGGPAVTTPSHDRTLARNCATSRTYVRRTVSRRSFAAVKDFSCTTTVIYTTTTTRQVTAKLSREGYGKAAGSAAAATGHAAL